ncbi:MAG: DNA polymerase Y family protein, partial [Myxococcota bacterium]|nr:DNA polymerase Y family protein [Myxococcota bacterium]
MFRYLVVHLPLFRLERCGWSTHQAVALVAEQGGAPRVLILTPAAQRAGVATGMTLAEARARLPALQVQLLDPEEEVRDLEDLTRQLVRVSPATAALPPSSMIAEVGHLARREAAVLERVLIRLGNLGHQACAVIADDPGTALACATWGSGSTRILPGQAAQALAPLPLSALDLPPTEQHLLHELGVRTVGSFALLPAAAVAARLGPMGVAAHTLAQGRDPLLHPAPVAPNPELDESTGSLVVSQDLPDPVDQLDALLFVLNALLRDGAMRLAAASRAATRVVLQFSLDDGRQQQFAVRLGTPTRDPARLLTLLRHRLEDIQLAAPVTGLQVAWPDSSPFHGAQRTLTDPSGSREALDQVLARLRDDLGSRAVQTPRLYDSHRPESAWRSSSSAPSGTPRSATPLALPLPSHDDPVQAWLGHPASFSPLRPPLLLRPPQPLDVRGDGGSHPPQAIFVHGRWL